MIGKKTITTLDVSLERDLKKELRDQGHYLTGSLERSMRPHITEGTSTVLEVTALDYINDLETGIPASHIDVNDMTYINGLTVYAQKRFGLDGKQAIKAALRIAARHKKEGSPTKNSYQFSNNGYRTKAIEETYGDNEKIYDRLIEDGISNELDDFINKTFVQTIF